MFIYNALNSTTYICLSYVCWSGWWINSMHFITFTEKSIFRSCFDVCVTAKVSCADV